MKKNEQEILLNIDEALAQMAEETPEMPEDFHAAWVRAVEEDQMDQQKNPETVTPDAPVRKSGKKLVLWTRLAAAAAAVTILIGGTVATRNSRLEEKAANGGYTTAAYVPDYEDADFGSMPAYGSTPLASAKSAQTNSAVLYEVAEEAAYMDADYAAEAPAEARTAGSSEEAAPVSEKKIVRTVSLTLGSKAYDNTLTRIREQVETVGGWVEYSSESSNSRGLRTVSMTLRIPAARLDEFIGTDLGSARIISRSESAVDMSDSYYDTQTRLETQQMLLKRLQTLITDTADLDDVLDLERQIADTQYNIDKLEGSLRSTDRKVSYATVDITLKEETEKEVREVREKTFFERIGAAIVSGLESFGEFLSDMAVFVVSALPWILLLAVAVIGIRIIIRKRKAAKAGKG